MPYGQGHVSKDRERAFQAGKKDINTLVATILF